MKYELKSQYGLAYPRAAFSARRTTEHQKLHSDCQQHNHQPCPERCLLMQLVCVGAKKDATACATACRRVCGSLVPSRPTHTGRDVPLSSPKIQLTNERDVSQIAGAHDLAHTFVSATLCAGRSIATMDGRDQQETTAPHPPAGSFGILCACE